VRIQRKAKKEDLKAGKEDAGEAKYKGVNKDGDDKLMEKYLKHGQKEEKAKGGKADKNKITPGQANEDWQGKGRYGQTDKGAKKK